MRRTVAWRYAAWSSVVSVAGALILTVSLVVARASSTAPWALAGWFVMAVTGAVGGAWLASRHGTPGSGFLLALAVGMLARLFFAATGAFAAAQRGPRAVWAYLAGLVLGYVPPQIHELVWFLRRTRRPIAEGRS